MWVSMRARFGKCTTYQLRLASADEEAAADLVSNDDWRDLQAQTRTGKPLGAVVLARRTLEAKSRVHLPSCPTLHRARRLEASASFAAVEMNRCWAHRTPCLIGVSFRTRTPSPSLGEPKPAPSSVTTSQPKLHQLPERLRALSQSSQASNPSSPAEETNHSLRSPGVGVDEPAVRPRHEFSFAAQPEWSHEVQQIPPDHESRVALSTFLAGSSGRSAELLSFHRSDQASCVTSPTCTSGKESRSQERSRWCTLARRKFSSEPTRQQDFVQLNGQTLEASRRSIRRARWPGVVSVCTVADTVYSPTPQICFLFSSAFLLRISFFHAAPSLHLQDLLHSVIISIVLVP